jgi:SAM-dependent methyltransferase
VVERHAILDRVKSMLWDGFQRVVGGNPQKKATLTEIITEPGRILEIGSATGNVADIFSDFDYLGIDTDASRIAEAQRRFPAPNYRFVSGDLLTSNLGAEAFDYVLMSHTAHHLGDELLARLASESCRLLKPGGRLVILDMNRPGREDGPAKHFYRVIDRGDHFRTTEELAALISSFTELEIERKEIRDCVKFRIRVIDQAIVVARKRSPVR